MSAEGRRRARRRKRDDWTPPSEPRCLEPNCDQPYGRCIHAAWTETEQ